MLKNIFLIPNYKDDIRNLVTKNIQIGNRKAFIFAITNFNDIFKFEIFNRRKTTKRPSIFHQYNFFKTA